jgi:glyoxalase family protein
MNNIVDRIKGLHHITAIAADARNNFEFYTRVLGLRLVKKTVNFDDPGTYHLYYGDEIGTPGTILTFFPWQGLTRGRSGTGMATEIGYSVPSGSLDFWLNRLEQFNIDHDPVARRSDEEYLSFRDQDGLQINLIVSSASDSRIPWTTNEISEPVAIRGFHGIVLTLVNIRNTASILTDILGYTLLKKEENRYRFITDAIDTANIIDLVETPEGRRGLQGSGTNHHVAFRVSNEEILMRFREKVEARGINITPKIDRNYFFSLYFREPGGVLFELATDNPGFSVDEPVNELGTHLKLPPQYEPSRAQIEKVLPAL